MILNDYILPVVISSISLLLLSCIVLILYIHSCIICIISNSKFIKFFSKKLFFSFLVLTHDRCLLFFFDSWLLSFNKLFYRLLFLKSRLIFTHIKNILVTLWSVRHTWIHEVKSIIWFYSGPWSWWKCSYLDYVTFVIWLWRSVFFYFMNSVWDVNISDFVLLSKLFFKDFWCCFFRSFW